MRPCRWRWLDRPPRRAHARVAPSWLRQRSRDSGGIVTSGEGRPAAELGCRCGQLHGRVANASPRFATRVVCYCDDCQAYLRHLGRADLLNPKGGTDVVQVAPAALSSIAARTASPAFASRRGASTAGTRRAARRRSATRSSRPFPSSASSRARSTCTAGGRATSSASQGRISGKFAIGDPPEGSTHLQPRLRLRALGRVLGWRLTGKAWPHPFFDRRTGVPRYPVRAVDVAERDALRPSCGPRRAG